MGLSQSNQCLELSLISLSEPTRPLYNSYAVLFLEIEIDIPVVLPLCLLLLNAFTHIVAVSEPGLLYHVFLLLVSMD